MLDLNTGKTFLPLEESYKIPKCELTGEDCQKFIETINIDRFTLLRNPLSPFLNYNKGGGGVWVQLLGVQGALALVIFALRECILNGSAVTLVPTFDDTGSLGSPPRQVVYPPAMVPP